MDQACDILVVGGGINGAAIARDAAGRGARVVLAEKDDLAAHTSSASTKLIHGGLRYLEQYDFRLVAKALAERERLMRAAPHLIRPLQFVLPHDRGMRPAWMMRIGLFLYDRLGGRSVLPGSRKVDLRPTPFGAPLKPAARVGFLYSDCWGDDSRLVVANALDAARHGATIMTRTQCLGARRTADGWQADLESTDGRRIRISARAIVNATGSWAADFLPQRAGLPGAGQLRLVKGSHIVVPRLFDGEHAYILQNPDGRVIFAIPYEGAFTLVGTTDVDWHAAPEPVAIDDAEIDYLCAAINRWFAAPIGRQDVVQTFAGLRPLFDDHTAKASEISRDYVLALDDADGAPPILSVFGGKITTHRALAEDAVDRLAKVFPSLGPAWTERAPMPGGDLGEGGIGALVSELERKAPFLDPATRLRMAQSYGTRVWALLGDATCADDLGPQFGVGLSLAEVEYLVREEWARSAEDVLWRRSKIGLHMRPEQVAQLEQWFAARHGADGDRDAPQQTGRNEGRDTCHREGFSLES